MEKGSGISGQNIVLQVRRNITATGESETKTGNGGCGTTGGGGGQLTRSYITRFFQGRRMTRKTRTLKSHHLNLKMRTTTIWIAVELLGRTMNYCDACIARCVLVKTYKTS